MQPQQSTHTGERPFACSKCEKRYNQQDHLKTHELTHAGGQPFACSKCEKLFDQTVNIKRYEKICTEERPLITKRFDNAITKIHLKDS